MKNCCWELPENAAKRPYSYQGHSEQTNIHVDTSRGDGVEFVLCAIDTHPCLSEFQLRNSRRRRGGSRNSTVERRVRIRTGQPVIPDMLKLLQDPCIWIGDMAATIQMTPHAVVMVPNADDKLKGQVITMGNRMQEITTMHGTIKGQMVNKNSRDALF